MKLTICAKSLSLALLLGLAGQVSAQSTAWTSVDLQSLAAFRNPTANWSLASAVSADRTQKHNLVTQAGTGILVNKNTDQVKGHLLSAFEHGDMDLELEVLMPSGSNSGIYLMGRYEIQLFDSWGQKSPAHSDMGGIYQRWNDQAPTQPYDQRGYEGKAPRVNACRAPGLLQKLSIQFQAPRFNAQGQKIANARFLRVVLNDAVIHQEAEVSGPTRGAAFAHEAATGPLLIQGDHGPVAFRNIRYRRFDPTQAPVWKNLNWEVWYGPFTKLDDFLPQKPTKTGQSSLLSWTVSDRADQFGIRYKGQLLMPEAGQHKLTLGYEYRGRLFVNGKIVADTNGLPARWWAPKTYTLDLKSGENEIELILFKNVANNKPTLRFSLEGPGYRSAELHELKSLPEQTPHESYYLEPGSRPQLQRVFAKGGGKLYPYSLAAGDPSGIHYLYNLNSGSVYRAWKGSFANMQGLWDSRGSDQVMWPLGGSIDLGDAPLVARLTSVQAAWPDTLPEPQFRHLRYRLDGEGRPTYEHRIQDLTVSDKITPLANYLGLRREIHLAETATDAYVRVAVGEKITSLADGSYKVEGAEYYIAPDWGKAKALVRPTAKGQELLVPLSAANPVKYSIEW